MPLPKLPTKRANLLDMDTAPKPRAPKKITHQEQNTQSGISFEAKSTQTIETRDAQATSKTQRSKATKKVQGKESTITNKTKESTGKSKLFVLDTNVMLHDPTCLFRFEEHDIFLPMMTLEELDHHKKGLTEVARHARQVSRSLDDLCAESPDLLQGMPLNSLGNKEATGILYFQTKELNAELKIQLPTLKADNQILSVVQSLVNLYPDREVVLVSKDINMRLKARALGLAAEDYLNDHSVEDSDLIYDGNIQLPDNFWERHSKDME